MRFSVRYLINFVILSQIVRNVPMSKLNTILFFRYSMLCYNLIYSHEGDKWPVSLASLLLLLSTRDRQRAVTFSDPARGFTCDAF